MRRNKTDQTNRYKDQSGVCVPYLHTQTVIPGVPVVHTANVTSTPHLSEYFFGFVLLSIAKAFPLPIFRRTHDPNASQHIFSVTSRAG